MKLNRILALGAAAVMLAACGNNGSTTVQVSSAEETETTTEAPIAMVSGENTGSDNISVKLPHGDWSINFDNQYATNYSQGDMSFNTAVVEDIDTTGLPQNEEELADRFSSEDTEVEVLYFSRGATENGTDLLRYTIKTYKSDGSVLTLLSSTEILDDNSAVVIDGIIRNDADDDEIRTLREAVDSAVWNGR